MREVATKTCSLLAANATACPRPLRRQHESGVTPGLALCPAEEHPATASLHAAPGQELCPVLQPKQGGLPLFEVCSRRPLLLTGPRRAWQVTSAANLVVPVVQE